jgi:DNA-binding NtrC family response regulator
MRQHAWPGTVRELEDAVHRAVVLAAGPQITAGDLGLDEPAGWSRQATLAEAPTGRIVKTTGDGRPAHRGPAQGREQVLAEEGTP